MVVADNLLPTLYSFNLWLIPQKHKKAKLAGRGSTGGWALGGLRTAHYSLHTAHYTMHTAYFTLHTIHYTLYLSLWVVRYHEGGGSGGGASTRCVLGAGAGTQGQELEHRVHQDDKELEHRCQ